MPAALTLLFLFGLAALFVHRQRAHQEYLMDRYDWLAQRSTPPYCPMELTASHFFYHGGGTLYITPGLALEEEWGDSSKVDIVGPDLKRLPDKVHVVFHSHWEDKTYQGTFDLPYERIKELFARGYMNRHLPVHKHDTYDSVIAGVAPGGAVSIWLSGVGRQTEVFFGYAAPVEVDWHATFKHGERLDRRKLVADELAELPDNPRVRSYRENFPFGLWERWRNRYAWYPVLENVTAPPYLFPVDSWNAEKDEISLPQSAPVEGGRAAPREIHYNFVDPRDRQICRVEMAFDEEEVLSAFERLGREGEPLQLVMASDVPSDTPQRLVLRGTSTSITLSKTKIRRLRTRRYAPP